MESIKGSQDCTSCFTPNLQNVVDPEPGEFEEIHNQLSLALRSPGKADLFFLIYQVYSTEFLNYVTILNKQPVKVR